MTSLCYRLGHLALELQAGTRDAAWQNAALLVHELQQEVRVFVINILDAVLLEAAILLAGILLVDTFVGEAHTMITGLRLPIVSVLSAGSSPRCGGAGCTKQRACP
jgi:hypothetical protein